MKQSQYIFDNETESFKLKDNLLKYLRFWPWFAISVLIFLLFGVLYVRYTPNIYESIAKIKIIDESKVMDLAADPLSVLAQGPQINLDNEIEIVKSYRLLNQVVTDLSLDISYYEEGNISTKQIYPSPFEIVKLFPEDSLKGTLKFEVNFETKPPILTDEEGESYPLDSTVTVLNSLNFPIAVRITDMVLVKNSKSKKFSAIVGNRNKTTLELSQNLDIRNSNKNSEILTLKLRSESANLSEAVLNSVIDKFNFDGIKDRQQVSKRTLEFIDERFEYLTQELDSIEGGKQNFKKENNLSYIETDAESSLLRKAETEEEVSKLGTQISLATVLKQTVLNQSEYELLPINIGLENSSLNTSVSNYNQMALERERLLETVGESHPTLVTLSAQLERAKVNIIKTVNVYQAQLRTSLGRLNQAKSNASSIFSSLPEKEKRLRAIERQQSIKENLFLLLLQKREEAAINLAVTAPSVKVVDYALTANRPVSPSKLGTLLISLILGIVLPFTLIFLKFLFNNKITDKEDLKKLSPVIPVLGQIPHLKSSDALINIDNRSAYAESFRILSTNISHLLRKNSSHEAKVVFVTSAIKGEGKTQIAQYLSLAFASLDKRVLLVGADLRNPQLHTILKGDKRTYGLSHYLDSTTDNWEACIQNGLNNNDLHKVCYSGGIPENAPKLLSNERFKKFIRIVKQHFDYIIVDTAPTMLVTDTFLIADQADATVFVARAGMTENSFIEFSKEIYQSEKLKNMAYVLNDVDLERNGGYGYGYTYKEQNDISVKMSIINKIKYLLESLKR